MTVVCCRQSRIGTPGIYPAYTTSRREVGRAATSRLARTACACASRPRCRLRPPATAEGGSERHAELSAQQDKKLAGSQLDKDRFYQVELTAREARRGLAEMHRRRDRGHGADGLDKPKRDIALSLSKKPCCRHADDDFGVKQLIWSTR
jgi:hypothetical protein